MTVENEGQMEEPTTGDLNDTKIQEAGEENVEPVDAGDGGDTEGGEPPAYTPDFSYKVNGEVQEFDPWIQEFVKDKETEEKIRDLYSRAGGLKKVKSERDDYRTRIDTMSQDFQKVAPVVRQYQELSGLLQKGDLGSFFAAARINPDQVIKWAANYVRESDKNPNYGQQIAENYNQQSYQASLEQQARLQQEQMQQMAFEQKQRELDWELSKPENSEFAQQFNARLNDPEGLRKEIQERGNMIYFSQNRVASVTEILEQIKTAYGFAASNQGQAGSAPQGGAVQGSGGKPVLPNVRGATNQSPAKKVYRSLDELKERAQALEANG